MSITYFAVATADPALVDALVGGTAHAEIAALDVEALYDVFQVKTRLYGRRHATLKWRGNGGGHVYVDLRPTYVRVTQSSTGDDGVIDVIVDVMAALTDEGLNVWDPQQGRWFPGSPAATLAPR